MEEPGGPRPTVEELQSLTVVKLRQRLAQYGIPQSGNKAALVERLDKFYTDRDAQAQAQQPQAFQSPPAQHFGEMPVQQDDLHVQQQLQMQLQQQQQEQQRLQLQQQQQQMAAEQAAIQERQRQEESWRQQQLAAAQAAEQQRLLQEEHARALAAEQERQEALRQQQLAEQAAAAEQERQILEQRERERVAAAEALRQRQLAAEAAAEEERQMQIRREEEERQRIHEEQMRQQMLAQKEAEMLRQKEAEEEERRRQEEALRQQQAIQEAEAERKRQEEAEAERQKMIMEENMRKEAERRQQEEMARREEAKRVEEEAYHKKLQEEAEQKQAEEAEQKRLQEMEANEKMRLQSSDVNVEMESENNASNIGNKKQPLFKASIGGARTMSLQSQTTTLNQDDMEDLDGQSTPAGPMPKSKGGPVPLMSLEVKPPSPNEPVDQDPDLPEEGSNSLLPKALEQALAFKSERAHEMGVRPEDIAQISHIEKQQMGHQNMNDDHEDLDPEDNLPSKGKQRSKAKKKKKKKNRPQEWARQAAEEERRKREEEERNKVKKEKGEEPDVEVEYIQDKLELDMSDPNYRTFSKIFEVFKIAENEDDTKKDKQGSELDKDDSEDKNEDTKKVPHMLEEDDMVEEEEPDENKDKLSKRKLKKLNRLSVAELKQLVSRPDVVEMHDVTAKDPNLLVSLKATRNSVPVPRHWCFKRKYLQGKRGIEKAAFDLPDFIKKTGIMEMRAALQEKETEKNMKSKMREKVRPKLGKIDIDYQKLHDAFFKWQTKPRMTHHGDLYYEGKEFEIRLKEKKPGDLSDDLRTALGMPVGPNAHKVPPPWLIAMQRYGPPPSYPNLKIPGLNAPIPEGCSFGYHAGGWGKPPVDETGKPLYGDVFGTADAAYAQQMAPEEIDTTLWGEMESESEEEESSEEEDEDEEQADDERAAGAQTPLVGEGLATPSGMSSVGLGGLGQETPELLELRKKKIEAEMEGGETPNLYTVLPERRNERIGASMMGSTHTYDIGQAGISGGRQPPLPVGSGGTGPGGVEMALNPEEVDLMDTEAMAAKAEAALRDQQANLAKEDLSDMVAEHAAKAANKRKRLANKDEGKSAKKYKEFKF